MTHLPAPSEIGAIPGDPGGIRVAASKYTATADAVLAAAQQLRLLAQQNEAGLSDAVDALVGVAGDVAERLDKLNGRYSTAGSALTTYAGELEDAQATAVSAVDLRDSAQASQSHSRYWAEHYDTQAQHAQEPAALEDAQEMVQKYQSAFDDAGAELTSAQQLYQQAVEKRDTAAETAASLISAAIESDGLNDSWWDDFSGWVADHAEILKAIKDVLGWIATGLAILSLFFPVLAPFALLAAGLTALLSLVLASTGQISWIEFGLDFLAFATMGVAAVAGSALKGTMATLKSTRIARVALQGTGKSPLRVVVGSFNGVMAPKVTVLNKLAWAKEIFSAGGKANAVAMRILTRSRAGAGGLADEALVSYGRFLVGIQRAAATTSGALHKTDLALGFSDVVAGVIETSGGAFSDATGIDIDSQLSDVSSAVRGAGDWYEGAVSDSTWRVGSSW